MFTVTSLIDSLHSLQLIPLMWKLQWLVNHTFYLMTAALPKCFKTGKMLKLPLVLLFQLLLQLIFVSSVTCLSSVMQTCKSFNSSCEKSPCIAEYFGNIKRRSTSIFGAWYPCQKISNRYLYLEVCRCYFCQSLSTFHISGLFFYFSRSLQYVFFFFLFFFPKRARGIMC